MADWTRSMKQRWAYYEVSPKTWLDARELTSVSSCRITRDMESDIRESATFDLDGRLSDEAWIRVYLEIEQDGAAERMAVGTFLCQTPSLRVDGPVLSSSVDAYSSLLELSDDRPPVGFACKGDVLANLESIVEGASHAPFQGWGTKSLTAHVVAEEDDTWLSYCRALAASAGCDIQCDEYGRIVMEPMKDISALRPVWTFEDGNSSILLPDIEETFDWFGLPNVCEVVWSEDARQLTGTAINKDPASLTSTVSRGRRVVLRSMNPEELDEGCTQAEVNALAGKMLAEASAVEREYAISHGFCPVRVGDCVRLRYVRHGIDAIAEVVSQEIECATGATVRSVLRVTERMWSA